MFIAVRKIYNSWSRAYNSWYRTRKLHSWRV